MKTRQIKLRAGFIMLVLVLVLVFAVQNAAFVEIQFFTWRVSMPRSVIVFSMLFIGFVIGWSSHAIYRRIKAIA